ncbi:SsrA-binding protein SmpB [Candidatus Falkowbacteria bacterium]|nr:SsrA-binding protein SmpB [Candidatus Falkowbacteria bacterium]
MKDVLTNKRALHDYQVLEKFEAGLVLGGPEVKSIKNSRADLKGAYISINTKGEPTILNFYIAPYPQAKREQTNYEPERPRKLLLNKKEINYLTQKQKEKGLTIMPVSVYIKNKLVKMQIGVCKGKRKADKREDIKKRDADRKMRRAMKQRM